MIANRENTSRSKHMIKLTHHVALIALTFALTGSARAEDRMRAGLWELTTAYNGTQNTHNTCFTPTMVELANSSAASMREATEKSLARLGNCTLKDLKLDGNKISTSMVCGAMSLAISSTYSSGAFETISTRTEAGVATASRIKGKFLGACK
jgi:hypothetical protein